jgi:hypothetical protein
MVSQEFQGEFIRNNKGVAKGGGAGGPPQTHPEILGRPFPNTLYCNLQFSEINTVGRRLLSKWD